MSATAARTLVIDDYNRVSSTSSVRRALPLRLVIGLDLLTDTRKRLIAPRLRCEFTAPRLNGIIC